MTDLVERLRGQQDIHMSVSVEDLLLDAAAEIEKLRAQVVSLQSSLDAGPPIPRKKTPDALEKP